MAIDLDAIRRKMAALGGGNKFWKPTPGEYKIRILPWNPADTLPEGDVFPTLWFYNLGEGRDWVQIAAPKQFDLPDPIAELLEKLWRGSEDDKAIAKKLRASGSTYIAFVLRGKEEQGVQVWKLPGGFEGQKIHQKLLSYFLDSEVIEEMGIDDWTDPTKGLDMKVTVAESDKVFNGKKVLVYTVEKTGLKAKKLSDDADLAKKWLDARPSVKDYYKLESYEAIEAKLNKWISAAPPPAASGGDGSSRAGKPDALDDLANAVKAPGKGKAAGKPKDSEDPAPVDGERKSLDDALKDLEGDDS